VDGACTVELGETNAGQSRNLSSVVTASKFADTFTGSLKLGKGRYTYTANCLPSNVGIVVEDGAQLFISDGLTVANALSVAGNGWTGESSYAISKAALRYGNNAKTTGTLTVLNGAGIGAHGSNVGSCEGDVIAERGFAKIATGTLNVSGCVTMGAEGVITVSSQISSDKFTLPEGYVIRESGNYTYAAKALQIDFTPVKGDEASTTPVLIADGDEKSDEGLRIDHKWLREKTAAQKWTGSHKPAKPIEVASTATEIAEVLNSEGENGAKVWESYVLGLDPAVAESKPVVLPVQSSNPDAITLKVGNVDVKEEAGANNVTYTVVYSDKPFIEAGDDVTESTPVNIGNSVELPLPTSGVRYYSMKVQVN